MAELENEIDVPQLTTIGSTDPQVGVAGTPSPVKLEEESLTRPGAQLADKQTFTNKDGETVICYPLIVDFRRLLQLTDDASKIRRQEFGILPGVSLC